MSRGFSSHPFSSLVSPDPLPGLAGPAWFTAGLASSLAEQMTPKDLKQRFDRYRAQRDPAQTTQETQSPSGAEKSKGTQSCGWCCHPSPVQGWSRACTAA